MKHPQRSDVKYHGPATFASRRYGLDRTQALELDAYLGQRDLLRLTSADAAWHAHLAYARRAAIALATNDLHRAMDDAAISLAALQLSGRNSPEVRPRAVE